MRPIQFSADTILALLRNQTIASLAEVMAALGAGASRLTAFRKLKDIDARTSYSHRGGYYFVATLGDSRRCHVAAFRHERQSSWFRGLEGACGHFGGVTREVLIDNPRPLVVEHDAAGHVAAVLGALKQLGLNTLIARGASRFRDLVLALIVARVIDARSKLATARALTAESAVSTLGVLLGLGDVDPHAGAVDARVQDRSTLRVTRP